MQNQIPLLYYPQTIRGESPEPVPFVLTDADLIRFLRIDETGVEKPGRTLERYRREGWLKGTQIGICIRYQLPDVLNFLSTARDLNPR